MTVAAWPSRSSSRADASPEMPVPTTHTFFFDDTIVVDVRGNMNSNRPTAKSFD
jgi:hypothetical protein